jgi:hypothetical protein
MGDTHRQREVEQAGIEITLMRRGPKLSKETVGDVCITSPSWHRTLDAIKPSTSRLDYLFAREKLLRPLGLRALCLEPIRGGRPVVSVGLAGSTLLLVRWAPLLVARPCNLDLIRLTGA